MSKPQQDQAPDASQATFDRSRTPQGFVRAVFLAFTLAAVCLAIHQLFNLRFFGIVLLEGMYLYLLAGFFLSLSFYTFRGWGGGQGVPLLDHLLALLSIAVSGYFAWTAETSLEYAWEYAAPPEAQVLSLVFVALTLEATRRAGGWILFFFVLFFALFPTFAEHMPLIAGRQAPFLEVMSYSVLSAESSFGIPMTAFGTLVIGFILFGAVLQHTGGGAFFNDLALALVGGFRGGAAKVAIFASGFMGSMSGSVISNVLTTGAVSIPAMRKTGFSARYAAATEACASTGGVLMPPIMGATAFIMASFLSRPYVDIAVAAAIPSLLYYFGLFVQVDAYAARRRLVGMARQDLPRLGETLRRGWMYLLVFAVLIYMMVAWRMDKEAPFYATGLLLLINQLVPEHRFTWPGFVGMIVGVGKALAELVAILLGVGLIIGAFAQTGIGGTVVNDLVFLAGGSTIMLLLMGAVTAFIFGMGMTVTACYIFLAVVLAPALVDAGLNQLAVHLFILYYGMVSYITPPVALGAFAAATMARTGPMGVGLEAMRLGGVIYVAPFFFVLNPALIGEGSAYAVVVTLATALVGVTFLGSGLQGYVPLVGRLPGGLAGQALRLLLVLGGLFCAAPGGAWIGLSHLALTGLGILVAAPALLVAWRTPEAAEGMGAA